MSSTTHAPLCPDNDNVSQQNGFSQSSTAVTQRFLKKLFLQNWFQTNHEASSSNAASTENSYEGAMPTQYQFSSPCSSDSRHGLTQADAIRMADIAYSEYYHEFFVIPMGEKEAAVQEDAMKAFAARMMKNPGLRTSSLPLRLRQLLHFHLKKMQVSLNSQGTHEAEEKNSSSSACDVQQTHHDFQEILHSLRHILPKHDFSSSHHGLSHCIDHAAVVFDQMASPMEQLQRCQEALGLFREDIISGYGEEYYATLEATTKAVQASKKQQSQNQPKHVETMTILHLNARIAQDRLSRLIQQHRQDLACFSSNAGCPAAGHIKQLKRVLTSIAEHQVPEEEKTMPSTPPPSPPKAIPQACSPSDNLLVNFGNYHVCHDTETKEINVWDAALRKRVFHVPQVALMDFHRGSQSVWAVTDQNFLYGWSACNGVLSPSPEVQAQCTPLHAGISCLRIVDHASILVGFCDGAIVPICCSKWRGFPSLQYHNPIFEASMLSLKDQATKIDHIEVTKTGLIVSLWNHRNPIVLLEGLHYTAWRR